MTGHDDEEVRRQLEQAILGEPPELTGDDIAAGAGVSLEEARRLWRALGFPDARDERAFTDSDLRALTLLMSAVDSEAISFDLAVQLTRAVGQTIARLADWQVVTLASRLEELSPEQDLEGRTQAALGLVDSVGVPFETLIIYAWRRHLAAAIARVAITTGAPGDEADDRAQQLTVGFADLVGFTARSNEMSRSDIGEMVERFESRCHDIVAGHRGRVIKTLGDSVLFVSDQPEQAIEISLGIIDAIGEDRRLPDVRVGAATGPVILRLGDVFGPAVNLASRLVNAARRNRVIVDRGTADLLPSAQYAVRSLPGRDVRGFGVVEPVAVRRIRD